MTMTKIEHEVVRWATADEAEGLPRVAGKRAAWVADPDWRVAGDDDVAHPCRGGVGCDRRPAAALARRYGPHDRRWWRYCAEHLYGRRIEGDRVLVVVLVDERAVKG